MPLYLIRQITTRFFQKYHIWYCVGHLDFKAIQSIRKIRCLVLTRRKFVSAELKGSVYDPRIHRSGRMKPEGFFNDGSEVRHPFNVPSKFPGRVSLAIPDFWQAWMS